MQKDELILQEVDAKMRCNLLSSIRLEEIFEIHAGSGYQYWF